MSNVKKTKKLGNSDIMISSLGLGCMGLSEFYGEPSTIEDGCKLIHHALEHGVNFFDTADMYGSGHNEKLIAEALSGRREQAVIATKFGIVREKGEYSRNICGKPEYIRKSCHESLQRLKTDYIDLYYIHRIDTETPIEETIGEMSRLVDEGKIRGIGICEASVETVRKAHAIHPLSALQSEYSMLTREPEDKIIPLTEALGITFVPYSPICRGLLSTSTISNEGTDVRKFFPRFQGESYKKNKSIADKLNVLAEQKGCSLAQLSLAWVLSAADNIVPIPGTTKIKNLQSNIAAADILLSPSEKTEINSILQTSKVHGERYTQEGMKGVDL